MSPRKTRDGRKRLVTFIKLDIKTLTKNSCLFKEMGLCGLLYTLLCKTNPTKFVSKNGLSIWIIPIVHTTGEKLMIKRHIYHR